MEQVSRDTCADTGDMDQPFSMNEFSLAVLSCNNSAPDTDGPKTDDSTGFGVLNVFHNVYFKLKDPCSV